MNNNNNSARYYVTSTGKIWRCENEERLNGESQAERELLGNDFSSPEDAALAAAKIKARTRTDRYAVKELRFDDQNNPIVEIRYSFPDYCRESYVNDLKLLVGNAGACQ